MATPEIHSVELDPLAPPFDEDLNAVESDEHQVVAAETRELPVYSFDSEDKTLVGIGSSTSAASSTLRHFDSSDQTLVGIGPAERARRAHRARVAELLSQPEQADPAPESVPVPLSGPMPHSEAPGPFVAAAEDDDDGVPDRLPIQKTGPWVFALSAVLLAAAPVALWRGVTPHTTEPHRDSATVIAPMPAPNQTLTHQVPFETAAAAPSEPMSLEVSSTQAAVALPPTHAIVQSEQPLEPASSRVSSKSAAREPLGALHVTSNPPSGLVLDGRPFGKAPRMIQLPAGRHTVLFVHPERGRMSVTVNVKAGRTTSASANF